MLQEASSQLIKERESRLHSPVTPSRTPVHAAYPDGGADLEGGCASPIGLFVLLFTACSLLSRSIGALQIAALKDRVRFADGALDPPEDAATSSARGGAAAAFAAESLVVIGNVGEKVASLVDTRVGAFAPSWVVGRSRRGCQTSYLILLHFLTLRCYFGG